MFWQKSALAEHKEVEKDAARDEELRAVKAKTAELIKMKKVSQFKRRLKFKGKMTFEVWQYHGSMSFGSSNVIP